MGLAMFGGIDAVQLGRNIELAFQQAMICCGKAFETTRGYRPGGGASQRRG